MPWVSHVILAAVAATLATVILHTEQVIARHHRTGNPHKPEGDISLWIDRQQIKMFSGELIFFPVIKVNHNHKFKIINFASNDRLIVLNSYRIGDGNLCNN